MFLPHFPARREDIQHDVHLIDAHEAPVTGLRDTVFLLTEEQFNLFQSHVKIHSFLYFKGVKPELDNAPRA